MFFLAALFAVSALAADQRVTACVRGDARACHDVGSTLVRDENELALERALPWFERGCAGGERDACLMAAAVRDAQQGTPEPHPDLVHWCRELLSEYPSCAFTASGEHRIEQLPVSWARLSAGVPVIYGLVRDAIPLDRGQAPEVALELTATPLLRRWLQDPGLGRLARFDPLRGTVQLYVDHFAWALEERPLDDAQRTALLACILIHELVHAVQAGAFDGQDASSVEDPLALKLLIEGHAALVQERLCPVYGSPEAQQWMEEAQGVQLAAAYADQVGTGSPAALYGLAREYVRELECAKGPQAVWGAIRWPDASEQEILGWHASGAPLRQPWCTWNVEELGSEVFGSPGRCQLEGKVVRCALKDGELVVEAAPTVADAEHRCAEGTDDRRWQRTDGERTRWSWKKGPQRKERLQQGRVCVRWAGEKRAESSVDSVADFLVPRLREARVP